MTKTETEDGVLSLGYLDKDVRATLLATMFEKGADGFWHLNAKARAMTADQVVDALVQHYRKTHPKCTASDNSILRRVWHPLRTALKFYRE